MDRPDAIIVGSGINALVCAAMLGKTSVNHRTNINGLWHIGASTHPGPGLGDASGFLAAEAIG